MKKSFIILTAALALASCTSLKEEFQPVFTLEYEQPEVWQPARMEANTSIAELAAMYETGKPQQIKKNIIISGIVSTTDQPGNFYKSLYIQDETGGIELKFGKNGLYNDYQPGQRIFVKCKGLTLGMYGYKTGNYGGNGMVQIGYNDPSGAYETSYLENSLLIDTHIFKGETGPLVKPEVISASQLPAINETQETNHYIGKLVTLKGLRYANEAFVLLYLNSSQDKKSYKNRVFLSPSNVASNPTSGITTWALSKKKMTEMLCSGVWDKYRVGSGNDYTGQTLADLKGDGRYPGVEKAAYSVSQYFKMDDREIQIRTSGYCKFADAEIPQSVLDGVTTIDITGILTLYQGSIQVTVNSIDDIVINE